MLLDARFYNTLINITYVKSVQLYESISKSSWTESVMRHMLTLVIVYAVGPVFLFLPLLEAPQKLAFLNRMYNGQQRS